MHPILEEQIKKYLQVENVESVPVMNDLLEAVSKTYSELESKIAPTSASQSIAPADRSSMDEVAEHMDAGAILLNKEGTVVFVNKKAAKLLGTGDPNEAITSLEAFVTTVAVKDLITQSLAGTSTTVPEVEFPEMVLSVSFTSLKEENSNYGTLIWLNDITAQKQLEHSKNQFITIASHEMRTPLAVIRGNAELLLDETSVKGDPGAQGEAQSVFTSAIRLLDIVNDFLDVQNLESGKLALKREPVDIPEVLAATIKELQKMADDKGITYRYIEMSKPPLITLDKSRLQQICINIISNAIHYTDHGNIIVTLETKPDHVKILFTDTGAGISEEDQKRLFKKFATGKTFLKTREYGSGLGLYISSMLAELMQSQIKLEQSTVGAGSTFSLTIPIPQGETTAPEAPVVEK